VLVQEEIGRFQDAVDTLTKRKTCKRRYIRAEETLTVSEVSNLIAEKEVVRTARRLRRGCAQRGAAAVAAKLDIIPAPIR
jgi:hypothetical protein